MLTSQATTVPNTLQRHPMKSTYESNQSSSPYQFPFALHHKQIQQNAHHQPSNQTPRIDRVHQLEKQQAKPHTLELNRQKYSYEQPHHQLQRYAFLQLPYHTQTHPKFF